MALICCPGYRKDTFSKLKDEILQTNLKKIRIVKFRDIKSFKVRYSLAINESEEQGLAKDLFTNQVISQNGEPNIEYFKNIGIKKINEVKYGIMVDIPESIVESLSNIIELEQYTKYFRNIETLEQLINAYQTLPLENQIDYSYFDFSKSPNVVQPSSF